MPEINTLSDKERSSINALDIVPQGQSLAQVQATGFEQDQKNAQYMAARQLKDPSKAPTPALRVVSTGAKIQRVKDSEQFKSLRPENQAKVLGHYYDKYTAPALKNAGIEPPSKDGWIKGHTKPVDVAKPVAPRLWTGMSEMARGYADTVRVAGNLLKWDMATTLTGDKTNAKNSTAYKLAHKADEKIFQYADSVSKVATDYDSTFQSRHDPMTWLSNFAGRAIGEAPAYMAAGELGGGIKIAEAVPALVEKAGISKGMAVGVHALKGATEVIGVMKAQGHSNKEAIEGGVFTFGLSGALHGAAMGFAAAKLALGGEPMANKISQLATAADHAEGIDTPDLTGTAKALVPPGDKDIHAAVTAERQLRELLAKDFYPEKHEAAGDKSVWRNLSKVQRSKIIDYISATNKHAAELMPLINPELQTMANTKAIVEVVKQNPMQAARMQAIQKLTGLNPAEVVTKLQAKAVGQETGLTSPAHELEQSFGEGDMFGGSRVKGAKTVSNANLLNPKLSTEDFVNGTRKYLEANDGTHSRGGKENFEDPEDHLLYVANFSDAPQPVKNRAFNILRKDFNLSREQASETQHGGRLANFREALIRTGHMDKEGNYFRSTRNTPRRYATASTMKVLDPESQAADMKAISKIVRKHPEMKATFAALNETLTQLTNKSATPITEKLRRTTQDRLVELMQRYK